MSMVNRKIKYALRLYWVYEREGVLVKVFYFLQGTQTMQAIFGVFYPAVIIL